MVPTQLHHHFFFNIIFFCEEKISCHSDNTFWYIKAFSNSSKFTFNVSSRWQIIFTTIEPYHNFQVLQPHQPGLGAVMILLLTFPHSFSLSTLCMLLPHAYYFLFTFLFPSTDFLFFHVQPYCLCIASCTVRLLMHSPAQSAY